MVFISSKMSQKLSPIKKMEIDVKTLVKQNTPQFEDSNQKEMFSQRNSNSLKDWSGTIKFRSIQKDRSFRRSKVPRSFQLTDLVHSLVLESSKKEKEKVSSYPWYVRYRRDLLSFTNTLDSDDQIMTLEHPVLLYVKDALSKKKTRLLPPPETEETLAVLLENVERLHRVTSQQHTHTNFLFVGNDDSKGREGQMYNYSEIHKRLQLFYFLFKEIGSGAEIHVKKSDSDQCKENPVLFLLIQIVACEMVGSRLYFHGNKAVVREATSILNHLEGVEIAPEEILDYFFHQNFKFNVYDFDLDDVQEDSEDICRICRENKKDCELECKHLFCRDCVKEMIASRDRKCPECRAKVDPVKFKGL